MGPLALISSSANRGVPGIEDVLASDSVSRTVVILDPARRILAANSMARRVLAAGAVLAARAGRLVCSLPVHERQLSSAISQLLRPREANDGAAIGAHVPVHFVNAESSQSLMGRIRMITHSSTFLRLALVALRDDAEADSSLPAELFGLTRAEARLVPRLMSGRELSEIAAELHLSLETTRTHLRAVFAKTGAPPGRTGFIAAAAEKLLRSVERMNDPPRRVNPALHVILQKAQPTPLQRYPRAGVIDPRRYDPAEIYAHPAVQLQVSDSGKIETLEGLAESKRPQSSRA